MKTDLPFYIVADFEYANIPVIDDNTTGINTKTLFKQIPSYVGYYLIDKITKENQYFY